MKSGGVAGRGVNERVRAFLRHDESRVWQLCAGALPERVAEDVERGQALAYTERGRESWGSGEARETGGEGRPAARHGQSAAVEAPGGATPVGGGRRPPLALPGEESCASISDRPRSSLTKTEARNRVTGGSVTQVAASQHAGAAGVGRGWSPGGARRSSSRAPKDDQASVPIPRVRDATKRVGFVSS